MDLVHEDQARHRRALLAVEAETALHGCEDRHVEVGRLVDDHRVLATELEEGLLEVALAGMHDGRALMDAHPRRHGAREVDESDPRIVDEAVADLVVGAGDQVHDPGRPARLLDAVHEHAGDDGRVGGGLEHHGVARRHRSDRAPHQDGQQEVPRRDHQTHADRFERGDVLLTRPRVRDERPVEVERGTGVVLDEVDRLGHVGVGFAEVLAGLERLPRAQLELAASEHRRELPQGASPVRCAPARPDGEGCFGGGEGAIDVLGTGRRCMTDHDRRAAGVERSDRALGGETLAAEHEGPGAAETRLDVGQGGSVGVAVGALGEVGERFGRVRGHGRRSVGHGILRDERAASISGTGHGRPRRRSPVAPRGGG